MQTKGHFLNALPTSGEITLLAVVVDKQLRPKRMGGSYLNVRLADRTGELEAKVWEHPEEVAAGFECGQVVKVRGPIEEFNGRPQLIINRIRTVGPDEFDPKDYCACSARDPEQMFCELQNYVQMVRRTDLRVLLETLFQDPETVEKLKTAPAALKIHHGFRAGLLEHVVSLCELAVVLANKYRKLDLDWLIAGAIWHDLGKIDTLTLTGVRFDYTTRGQLLEHVTLGLERLERLASRVPTLSLENKTILQHLIVSHHGQLEHGALRRPMTPEAMVLHLMDLMDARLEQMFRLIEETPETDEFTSYVPSLERQIFRGLTGPST